VAIGRDFFGESMFSAPPMRQKVALVALVARARPRLPDARLPAGRTPLMASLGAREIRGASFCAPRSIGKL